MCGNCKRYVFVPSHPLADMGIDLIKDTFSYVGKLKNVGSLINLLRQDDKKDDKEKDV